MPKNASASSPREKRATKSVVPTSRVSKSKPAIAGYRGPRVGSGPTQADLQELPELTAAQLRGLVPLREWEHAQARKQQITLRLDADILAWFRSMGSGYQSRINEALRRYVSLEKRR